MPRELKTNGIYNVTCTLTGEAAGTTPAVFAKRAKMYGLDPQVLRDNYIGRTAAKVIKTLVNAGKTPEAAVEAIRAEFGTKSDKPVLPEVMKHIVAPLGAKQAKAEQAAAFEAKRKAALAKLLGDAKAGAKADKPAKAMKVKA